jgi:hypothetical protein
MDAADAIRKRKKEQLLKQLAELLVEEQRARGVFKSVPHYSVLEQAAHAMGQELSCAAQQRVVAEVVATGKSVSDCPTCGREQPVTTAKRTMTSLDGPIEVLEAKAHCPACRRDFFPSA